MAAEGADAGRPSEPLPWPVLDPWPEGWLGDTPAEAVAVWQRMTPARRVATARGLLGSARARLAAGVRLRHPGIDEGAVAAAVATLVREAADRG